MARLSALRLPFRLWIGLVLLALVLVVGLVLPSFAPVSPLEWYKAPRNRPAGWPHLLGTTNLGQDIFWLLTWALEHSLLLGAVSAALATLIGVAAGLLAGYSGGWVDRILSFFMDALLCVPSLPVLILLAALFGGQLSLLAIGVTLVVFNWPYPARQVRAVALTLREREFIDVAWFCGESRARILARHIFPYIAGWSAANFINTVLVAIATETSLAVIGLSSAQQATLGTMIYWAIKYQAILARRYLWVGSPVLAVVLLFVGLFLLSSSIAERNAARRLGA